MKLRGCVKFQLSPIFAISRTLNEDVLYGLFFAVSIFGDFKEVANSAKIKPTRKIPDIRYYYRHIINMTAVQCRRAIDIPPASVSVLTSTCRN